MTKKAPKQKTVPLSKTVFSGRRVNEKFADQIAQFGLERFETGYEQGKHDAKFNAKRTLDPRNLTPVLIAVERCAQAAVQIAELYIKACDKAGRE